MFLLEPNETPYDLRFSIGRIPVRVHPMFWLFSAVLGCGALPLGPQYLIGWVALVFVSILVHELGHVWMGHAFGADGRIVLYSFGGLAVGSNRLSRRWQRILVSFAGPLAGFVFLAIVLVIEEFRVTGLGWAALETMLRRFGIFIDGLHDGFGPDRPIDPFEEFLLLQFCVINFGWGLINLLPVWPLDGGQISRDALEGASPRNGTVWALGLSGGVAAVLAIHSLLMEYRGAGIPYLHFGDFYTALMFGLLAVQSFQMLQQIQAQSRWHDDHWR